MDYEQMLQSMLCRNCYEGAGWWDTIISSNPDEVLEESQKPPVLCVETWYTDYEDEDSDIVTHEYYYHLWCKKCLPTNLR